MSQTSFVCPLCKFNAALQTKRIPSSPIRTYWKSIGYDIDSHHIGFPEVFQVFSCVKCGLGTFSPTVIGEPELYATLGAHEFYYEPARWDHRSAMAFLQSRKIKTLLEFGCGDGQFLDCISKIVPKVVGVDFNGKAVESARARGLNARTSWVTDTDALFDAIATFQTLEHVPSPGDVVNRLVERLAPNGYLIIAVPNEDGPLGHLSANPLNLPPHHATLWPKTALNYIAEKHGLVMELYATEPMNRALYLSVVEDSIRESFSGASTMSRLAVRLLRPAIQVYVAMQSAMPETLPYLGHNHIAIYRKQNS